MVQTNNINKQKLLILSGATAVGKSSLAIQIAKQINGEIISADSMQVYRHLNIGTGKVTQEEMSGVEHYLIDIVNPDFNYSVANFVSDAEAAINLISAKGKIPIITGGTGLYINALLNGFNLSRTPGSETIREKLNDRILNEGSQKLHEELKNIDPESAEKISVNDAKRIVRALEIYYLTGQTKSEVSQKNPESNYDYLFFVLDDERAALYERINNRVDKMMQQGLEAEVRSLYQYKNCNSMQAIGYKEMVKHIDSEISLEKAVDQIKQGSRNYAKRQITYLKWMQAEKEWVTCNDISKVMPKINIFLG